VFLRVFRLGTPRSPHEGLRIGTMRRPPRGVAQGSVRRRQLERRLVPHGPQRREDQYGPQSTVNEAHRQTLVKRFRAKISQCDASRRLNLLVAGGADIANG